MKYAEDNNLPFKLSIKRDSRTGETRDNWGYSCHNIGDYSTWDIMFRTIENNIGKSFAMTFHYYCKLVPKYCQNDFLEKFKHIRLDRYNTYYVDDLGSIQRYKPKNEYKGPYTVKSLDYKIQYKRIDLGKGGRFRDVSIKDNLTWYDDPDDFEKIIRGQIWEFESKKDPVYVKYKREQFKRDKKRDKDYKKEKRERSELIFNKGIMLEKERIRKQRELDLVKIFKHGFDSESFKGDFYHGRKNKIKLEYG